MRVRLDKFNNDWYKPGSKVKIAFWMLFSSLFFRSSLPWPMVIKKMLLRVFGCKFGKGLVLKPSLNIKYPWKLFIGDYVWLGEDVWIDNLANIYIENHVCVSQGAMLLTGNHDYKQETFDLVVKEIRLENGVWIGAKSIVCPGVICHENSILSVGAVATKNLEKDFIYRGNPATQKRER